MIEETLIERISEFKLSRKFGLFFIVVANVFIMFVYFNGSTNVNSDVQNLTSEGIGSKSRSNLTSYAHFPTNTSVYGKSKIFETNDSKSKNVSQEELMSKHLEKNEEKNESIQLENNVTAFGSMLTSQFPLTTLKTTTPKLKGSSQKESTRSTRSMLTSQFPLTTLKTTIPKLKGSSQKESPRSTTPYELYSKSKTTPTATQSPPRTIFNRSTPKFENGQQEGDKSTTTKNKIGELENKSTATESRKWENYATEKHSETKIASYKYLFVVRTDKENTMNRYFIRSQWKKSEITGNTDAKLLFVVEVNSDVNMPENVKREKELNNDIVWVKHATPGDRTIKTLYALKTAFKNIAAELYAICLDDTFVNFDSVVKFLQKTGMNNTVYGAVTSNPVHVNPKTDLKREMHHSFYVISGDVMPTVLKGPGQFDKTIEWLHHEKIWIAPLQRIVTMEDYMGEIVPTTEELFSGKILSRAGVSPQLRAEIQSKGYYRKVIHNSSSFWGYFRPRETKQWSAKYDVRIDSGSCEPGVEVVIMVHSHPGRTQQRNTTRHTWASPAHGLKPPYSSYTLRTKLLFVVGDAGSEADPVLNKEAEKYGDILQGTFKEHYNNLTLKHVFALKWIAHHCSNVKYVMKVDDDVIVNLPYLQQIASISTLRRSIVSDSRKWHMAGPWPRPLTSGKWGVSGVYPWKIYPYYSAGTLYLVTVDIVKDIAANSEYIPYLFIDDVFVTGMLSLAVDVNLLYYPQWRYEPRGADTAISIAEDLLANRWVHTYHQNKAEAVWKELRKRAAGKP